MHIRINTQIHANGHMSMDRHVSFQNVISLDLPMDRHVTICMYWCVYTYMHTHTYKHICIFIGKVMQINSQVTMQGPGKRIENTDIAPDTVAISEFQRK